MRNEVTRWQVVPVSLSPPFVTHQRINQFAVGLSPAALKWISLFY